MTQIIRPALRIHPRPLHHVSKRLVTTSSDSTNTLAKSKVPSHQGIVPFHRSLLVIHTKRNPSTWPSKVQSIIPVYPALQVYARNHGAIINVAHFPSENEPLVQHSRPQDLSGSFDIEPDTTPDPHDAQYTATLFRAGSQSVHEISDLTLSNVEKVSQLLDPTSSLSISASYQADIGKKIYIFVCTHGSRDCRCGVTGGEVVEEMRRWLANNRPAANIEVKVGEVAHVGGHKWAANVLVYPPGDWYRLIEPEDIPQLMEILSMDNADSRRHLAKKWSGRMGMTTSEQKEETESRIALA